MPPISCRSIENCGSSAEDREQRADLDDQRRELAAARLLLRGRVLVDVLLVDVAGPQVRRGDRHDRGRHECADADRGEGDAGEPAGNILSNSSGTIVLPSGLPAALVIGTTPALIAM